LGLLTSIIAAVFYLREKRRREELEMITQIDALERSAIQAQMNPHFVFNSLNSIQHFILESDTKQAVYYLARFASLIRKTLRASVDGPHSLKEEIEMLKIYLALEKLRFKDTFDYQITIAPNINPEGIYLAPMLVQPFVENAIIHGVADMDRGGLITVHFGRSSQEIQVTITDNGKGFDPEGIDANSSLGVSITRKRLNKNLNNKQLDGLRIEPRRNQEGQPAGTVVHLRIKPVKTSRSD
ncbi:MAG: histidine kinase, partial [Bacteroidota bacterium]